jgi:hypothetical protein
VGGQKMTKENKFTYNGILYTLKYFFEVLGNKVSEDMGIGIVPYVYTEAKIFYEKRADLIKKAGKIPSVKTTQTIKVSTSKKSNKYLIDLEKL